MRRAKEPPSTPKVASAILLPRRLGSPGSQKAALQGGGRGGGGGRAAPARKSSRPTGEGARAGAPAGHEPFSDDVEDRHRGPFRIRRGLGETQARPTLATARPREQTESAIRGSPRPTSCLSLPLFPLSLSLSFRRRRSSSRVILKEGEKREPCWHIRSESGNFRGNPWKLGGDRTSPEKRYRSLGRRSTTTRHRNEASARAAGPRSSRTEESKGTR